MGYTIISHLIRVYEERSQVIIWAFGHRGIVVLKGKAIEFSVILMPVMYQGRSISFSVILMIQLKNGKVLNACKNQDWIGDNKISALL